MQDIWWFKGLSQLWAHNCRYLNQLSVQTDCKAEILPHQLARIPLWHCSFHPVLVYHRFRGRPFTIFCLVRGRRPCARIVGTGSLLSSFLSLSPSLVVPAALEPVVVSGARSASSVFSREDPVTPVPTRLLSPTEGCVPRSFPRLPPGSTWSTPTTTTRSRRSGSTLQIWLSLGRILTEADLRKIQCHDIV